MILENLKGNQAKVTTFLVTSDDVDTAIHSLNITLDVFLTILEQYLILSLIPTVNKLIISTSGGTEVSSLSKLTTEKKIQLNPKTTPIYCYMVDSEGYVLLHVLQSQNSLGKALNKRTGYAKFVMEEQNGWIRDKLFITKTPIANAERNQISFDHFISDVKSVLDTKASRKGHSVTVIDASRGIEVGTFPSISYVSKHIIKGANRYGLKQACYTGKAYSGYYLYTAH